MKFILTYHLGLSVAGAAMIVLFLGVLFISLVEQMIQFAYIFGKELMRRI